MSSAGEEKLLFAEKLVDACSEDLWLAVREMVNLEPARFQVNADQVPLECPQTDFQSYEALFSAVKETLAPFVNGVVVPGGRVLLWAHHRGFVDLCKSVACQ